MLHQCGTPPPYTSYSLRCGPNAAAQFSPSCAFIRLVAVSHTQIDAIVGKAQKGKCLQLVRQTHMSAIQDCESGLNYLEVTQ